MKFLVLIFSVTLAWAKAQNANSTITIAVVEFNPIRDGSPKDIVSKNTQRYLDLIDDAENKVDQKVHLILFPEATLLDDPSTAVEIDVGQNPCTVKEREDEESHIKQFSCKSRDLGLYIVVNLVEKEKCDPTNTTSTNCKETGFYFYNTDVVFDSTGTIYAKYRKFNLFGEYDLDRTDTPDVVVFTTDFNVTFGIFTCFDILFKSPAQDVLALGVDAVLYPTMWFGELPFLTALQTQQMWAHTHNVKFFSSGANFPLVGSSGTGIYSGSAGSILTDIIASGGSQTYIYNFIPGGSPDYNPQPPQPYQDPDALAQQMDSFHLKTDSDVVNFNSTILDTSIPQTGLSETVCYEEFCCDFTITTRLSNSETGGAKQYTYHLVAFSGARTFTGVATGGIDLCGVIACLDSSLASCGQRFPDYAEVSWPVTFEELTIKGQFEVDGNKTQFPNSVLSSIRPINASQTIWEQEFVNVGGKNYTERTFAIDKEYPQDRLLTFAIFGRNFALDSFPRTPTVHADASSVTTIQINSMLFTFVLFYVVKLVFHV